MPLAVKPFPIRPLFVDAYSGTPHIAGAMGDGEGVGVAEIIEDTATDPIEVGIADTTEDRLVDSTEGIELVDDAIVKESVELIADERASEELGDTGCDGSKQASSYKCAVGIFMNPVT
jgi:hypothetical protein